MPDTIESAIPSPEPMPPVPVKDMPAPAVHHEAVFREFKIAVGAMFILTIVLVTLYWFGAKRDPQPKRPALNAPSSTLTFSLRSAKNRPAASQPKASAVRVVMHRVAPHEKLADIARKYYGDATKWPAIAKYNGITTSQQFTVGREIKIPLPQAPAQAQRMPARAQGTDVVQTPAESQRVYTVKSGDSLWKIARDACGNPNKSKELQRLNNLPENAALTVGMRLKLPEGGTAAARRT
jgi:nucleoid-associated protein YgaU